MMVMPVSVDGSHVERLAATLVGNGDVERSPTTILTLNGLQDTRILVAIAVMEYMRQQIPPRQHAEQYPFRHGSFPLCEGEKPQPHER
jgi:hypothetical protein